jgi:uncharacterized protein (TIGR02598 family)
MKRAPENCRIRAFSLIEITMAIGIISFAFIALIGLIPVGLTTFHKAMDVSTNSRIVQQVVTDLQQGTKTLSPTTTPPALYFDNDGDRQAARTTSTLYDVNTIIQSPSSLPGGTTTNLVTVVVEIVKNPGNAQVQLDTNSAVIQQPGMSISRVPVLIATSNQ